MIYVSHKLWKVRKVMSMMLANISIKTRGIIPTFQYPGKYEEFIRFSHLTAYLYSFLNSLYFMYDKQTINIFAVPWKEASRPPWGRCSHFGERSSRTETINVQINSAIPLNTNNVSRFYRNNTPISFIPYFSPSCLTSGEERGWLKKMS